MGASALFMMIVGMVIIWGGLAASITFAVKKAKQNS
ncbi:methionine/alanine import family NSS transporter small subunit [Bacillus sp. BGMRC 2118]|nr:methionine/alanine import family NSS transporter small subunit [Bacillus sp. BGMRC 2118]